MTTEKVREDRLRRMARRQGFTLRKSRTRDPRALTYGAYFLLGSPKGRDLPPGQPHDGLSLDEVERFLSGS
jgi:hypothetical protein